MRSQDEILLEHSDLADKVVKLNKYVAGTHYAQLSAADQDRLSKQLHHMTVYRCLLEERIAAFPPDAPAEPQAPPPAA